MAIVAAMAFAVVTAVEMGIAAEMADAVVVVMATMMMIVDGAVDSEDELMHEECRPRPGKQTVVVLSLLSKYLGGLPLL